MIAYSLLPITAVSEVFEKVKKYLPDMLRTPEAFSSMYAAGNTMFLEVGAFGGVFWLSDIIMGWRAEIHVVLWDKEVKGQYKEAQGVIKWLFGFLRLKRLEAYVPTREKKACEYAERLNFTMEGILRKRAIYDGDYVDVAAYSILLEDL